MWGNRRHELTDILLIALLAIISGCEGYEEMQLHMVSAWVREDSISLGQIKTDEKSNEITAIPQLLSGLDISSAIVTIDAMGCQRDIARKIIEQQAHYLLAVKGNHPTLHEEIDTYFLWAQNDAVERKHLSHHTETTFEHGRTVRYHAMVTQDIVWFEDKANWKNLRTLVYIERTREKTGITSTQRAYYISSLQADAAPFLRLPKGHWRVENQLHWMLDVAFREDACPIFSGHSPQNISLLRKMALLLLKLDSSIKASIPQKRRLAAYDNDFAFSVWALL